MGKNERGRGFLWDCPTFLNTPIITGMGKATNFKFGWYIQSSKGPSEQKPIKTFGKKVASAYPCTDCPRVLPIISGTGKATNFKFCKHILGIDRKKSPLQISGKVAVGVVRNSRNFSGHPCIGRIARSSLR